VSIALSQSALEAAQRAKNNERVNELERVIADMAETSPVDMPVTHRFTPGLYSREIFMPKGALLTSRIHQTEHMYAVLTGVAHVWTDDEGVVTITAPFIGVTKAGTRRVLFIQEDCRWATFHPTKETNIEQIEAELIYPHDIPGKTALPK
jgi:hypothetical protein